MKISKRAQSVPSSGIRKMFEIAKDYDNVINLCIGEPGFKTPQNIVDAGKATLDKGYIRYTSTKGIDELREVIGLKLKKDNNIVADPVTEILITPGAGESLAISLLALIDPGDEIILPNPHWPNYLGHIAIAGGQPVLVDTFESDNFSIKAEAIEEAISDKTKVILLNSPSNPTGAIIGKEELIKIGRLAKKHDIMIVSDEPYEKLIYDGLSNFSLASLEEFKDHVITVNSFSKTYAMTGWRIGYAQGPARIIKAMTKLQENLSTCVNYISQNAAVEAMSGPQEAITEMAEEYRKRRDLLVNGLNELQGVSCIMPQGTFFAFANIKGLNMSSEEVAETLVKEVQVVTTPGNAFGSAGEGYLRFSFASSEEDIIEALARLKRSSLFNKQ